MDARDGTSEIRKRLLARSISVDQANKMRACFADWCRTAIAEIGEGEVDQEAIDVIFDDKSLSEIIADLAGKLLQ